MSVDADPYFLVPIYSGRKAQEEKLLGKEDITEASLSSTNHEKEGNQSDLEIQKASANDRLGGTNIDKTNAEQSGSDHADTQKISRPMSPGTLALMCDEEDTMFITPQNAALTPSFPANQNMSEVYAEQERGVLMKFRDYIRKIVTCGRMKGILFFSPYLFMWVLLTMSY